MKTKQHELVIDDNLTLVSTEDTESTGTFNVFLNGKCTLCRLTGRSISSVAGKKPIVRSVDTVRLAGEWLADIMRPLEREEKASIDDSFDAVTALLTGHKLEGFGEPEDSEDSSDIDWQDSEVQTEPEFEPEPDFEPSLIPGEVSFGAETEQPVVLTASIDPLPETTADLLEQAKAIFSAAIDALSDRTASDVIGCLIDALIALNQTSGSKNPNSIGSRKEQVKSIIAGADHAVSVADIAKASGMNYSYAFRLVKDLLEDGSIVRESSKKFRAA